MRQTTGADASPAGELLGFNNAALGNKPVAKTLYSRSPPPSVGQAWWDRHLDRHVPTLRDASGEE